MSNWKESDFSNYWQYYNATVAWSQRSEALLSEPQLTFDPTGIPGQSNSDLIQELTLSAHKIANGFATGLEDYQLNEEDDMEYDEADFEWNEAEMTPEMIEFVNKTKRHREELARKRAEAAALKEDTNWLTEDIDNYVFADQIGVHGAKKLTTDAPNHQQEELEYVRSLRLLYGEQAPDIQKLEQRMNSEFELLMSEPGAALWPNIPLRF